MRQQFVVCVAFLSLLQWALKKRRVLKYCTVVIVFLQWALKRCVFKLLYRTHCLQWATLDGAQ